MGLVNFLKALSLSEISDSNEFKGISRMPTRWKDERFMSPKEQGDISGVVLRGGPTANNSNYKIDYEYIEKMYECHDMVFNCVQLVSNTFSQAKLRVKKKVGKVYNYLPDHPLQKLLNSPNSSMTAFDLKQAFMHHRLLYGNLAMALFREGMYNENGEPYVCNKCSHRKVNEDKKICDHIFWDNCTGEITQIMPMHRDKYEQDYYTDATGKKRHVFFHIDKNNGTKMPIHPDNIITSPIYNTVHSFYGTSPTQVVSRWLNLDLSVTHQISAYFANNASPNAIVNIKYRDDEIEDPDALTSHMAQAWDKQFGKGGKRERGVAITYGDMQVFHIQDTLKDILQKDLFAEAASRIVATYGVPPSRFLYGVQYNSNGSTSEQEMKNFYHTAISPQLDVFKEKIERHVLPSFNDPKLEVEWDLTDMGIAEFLEKSRKADVYKQWEMGISKLDETRYALGKDPIGGEEGESRYRISVMSDGFSNSSGTPIDNRAKPDPEVDKIVMPENSKKVYAQWRERDGQK